MNNVKKYVKLVARPDTWFKAGTEVYDYNCHLSNPVRMTLKEYNDSLFVGIILVRGIRVCEDNDNENGMGCKPGEERGDGETCAIDEFDMEITDSPK